MFQLLRKLSLFWFFLICASADSKEEGLDPTTRLFPRQNLPAPRLNAFRVPASLENYRKLYTALSTKFAPNRDMSKYVRFSIYDILSKDRSSCPAVLFRPIPLPADLDIFLKEFNSLILFSTPGKIYPVLGLSY
jgi:hypothetical protein